MGEIASLIQDTHIFLPVNDCRPSSLGLIVIDLATIFWFRYACAPALCRFGLTVCMYVCLFVCCDVVLQGSQQVPIRLMILLLVRSLLATHN
jgi:hypothetical protein